MNAYPVTRMGARLVFDTTTFNEAAQFVTNASNLVGGRGVLMTKLRDRIIITLDRQMTPLHPWHTSLQWREEKDEKGKDKSAWLVRIVPGFVNGKPPEVPALAYENDKKVTVKPTLLDDVAIPIPNSMFRDIRGAEYGEAVSRYFQDLGVKEEKAGVSIGTESVVLNLSEQEQEGERLLRAVDIVLTAFRATYKVDVSFPANLVTGQLVDYSVLLDISQALRPTQISVMQKIPPPKTGNDLIQRLIGNYGDDGFDQILVSTVYFVSPPKSIATKPLDTVTDEWTPVVKHNLFWNVGYWSDVEPPKNFQQLQPGLGLLAFTGRYTVAPAATLGAMEAMFQSILNAAFNEPPKGVFYTA